MNQAVSLSFLLTVISLFANLPARAQTSEDPSVLAELEGLANLSPNEFQFGKYSFNQNNTPDYFEYIPFDENAGGATFHDEAIPTASTHEILFPNSQEDFNFLLCVGNRIDYAEGIARSLNMPAGNIGLNKRTGVQLSWSGGRTLPNNGGIDLVVFETGDSPGEPDAFMVRVLNANTNQWTRWRYQASSGYELPVARRPAVVFCTEIDLTDMGIPPGDSIKSIQLANMTAFDRIAGVGDKAEGFVVFGKASSELPKPDPKNEFTKFFLERNLFDPDILYVAAIHDVRTSSGSEEDSLDDFFR